MNVEQIDSGRKSIFLSYKGVEKITEREVVLCMQDMMEKLFCKQNLSSSLSSTLTSFPFLFLFSIQEIKFCVAISIDR